MWRHKATLLASNYFESISSLKFALDEFRLEKQDEICGAQSYFEKQLLDLHRAIQH